jgi:hypothetical protein
VYQKPQFKTRNSVATTENTEKTLNDMGIGDDFLNRTLNSENKSKINKWDCRELKKLLHNKENNYQSKQAAYRMRKKLCQLFI